MYIKEVWKPIKGYEGRYEVSSMGRVRSLINNIILRDSYHRDGYKKVVLHKNGKKTFQVHRLVAIAFIDNPENKPQVNHKNGVKDDNRLDNLEWVSVSENTKHAYDIGKAKSNGGFNQKPVHKLCPETNTILETFNSISDASVSNGNTNRYGIRKAIINNSVYLGFKWKFA